MAEPNRDENRPTRPPAQGARTLEEPEFDEVDDFDSDSDEENAAASDRLLEEDAVVVRLEKFPGLSETESFLIRGVGDTDFSEGSEKRRQIASPQMFNSLLSAALKNPRAEAVLGDLSSKSIGPFEADPLLDAIEVYRRNHPESSAALKTAAIQASQLNSKQPLNNFIAQAAAEDPKFESQLREILGSHLRSGKHEEQGAAVGILLAMSKQWKPGDFQTALRFMQPDQVRDFRNALNYAPTEVHKEALRLALAGTPDLLSNLHLTQNLSADGFMSPGRAPKLADGEASAMQARIRLIAGESAQGQPLWNLHKQYGVEQAHWQDQKLQRDNPLLGPKKDDPFKLFISPVDSKELEQAKKLFLDAFPKHSDFEKSGHKWDRNLDTRYLAATLTASMEPGSGKPLSPEQIFKRWGIDSERFSTEIASATKKYGADTLLALDRRVQLFNALDENLRARFAGEGNVNPIKTEQLAGLVLNGHLGDKNSSYAFLMDKPPFEEEVRRETQNTASMRYSTEKLLSQKITDRDANLQMLSQYTTNGVSALDLLGHGADKLYEAGISSNFPKFIADGEVFTSGVEAFETKQAALLKKFRDSELQVDKHAGEFKVASAAEVQLEFARKIYAYEQIAQSGGSQEQKDYLALMMLDSYGMKTVKERAPQIWNDLQQGGLQRLADNKLIQSSQFPEITGTREERLATAMKITSSLKANSDGYLDVGIRRNQALAVFDSDPALMRSQEKVLEFGKDFATFSKLFEASNKGTKYEDIVKDLKKQAGELQGFMTSAKPEDIADLKDLQKKLTDALESATDPETRQALEARAASVKGVLDILDPSSKQHKDLLKLLTDAQTRDFSPDDLANWLRNNGPAIAVAAAAVAITVATMGTGAPIAMVLVSSAVALGATQLTSEVLYQLNHRIGDTGLGGWNDRSYVGAWGAKHEEAFQKLISSSDWKGTNEAAKELITSYIKEVALPTTMEYATNVVMGLVSLGALRLGQAGLKGLDAQWVKGLVANPRSLELINAANKAGFNSTSKGAMTSWLRSIAKETAQESMEEMGEEGVQVVAEKALKQLQLNSPNASVLLAVSMGLAQGLASRKPGSRGHVNVGSDNQLQIHSSMRDSVVESLEATGHFVKTLPDGSLAASTYQSPDDKVMIRVSDEEAPANGRKRPGGRTPALDENFGRRFASGDPNDSLGPDNRLRQTTLRRQIENNFPEDVHQAAGELVTGGLQRQELLERMLRMGSADCERFGVFELIKNNRDLDVLKKGIDAAETKSRTQQSINRELDKTLATLPPVREKLDNLHLLQARADHAAKQELAWKSLGPDAEAQLVHWQKSKEKFSSEADALTNELAPEMGQRANALQTAFNSALAQHSLPPIAIDVTREGTIEGKARYNAATGRIELSPSILLSANSSEVKNALHREYEKFLSDRARTAGAPEADLPVEQSADQAAAMSARQSAKDARVKELAQVAENLENNQRHLLNEGGVELLLGRLSAQNADFEQILGVAPPPALKELVTKFEQSRKPDGTIDRKKWTEASAAEVSKMLFHSVYTAGIKAQSDLQRARADRAPTPGEIAFDKARLDNTFIDAIASSEFSVDPMTQMDRRTELAMDYSWAIPDRASLSAIYDFSQPGGVVEVGAGKGLWAGMLRQMGVDVAAYDINATNKDNPYHRGDNISPVEQGGIEKAADHPDKTLLLSWPPPDDPMGADVLKKYTEAGGTKLVFIGERPTPGSGFYNTGDKQFHTMLDKDWVLKEVVDMKHMPDGFNLSTSRLYQYERRTAGETAP